MKSQSTEIQLVPNHISMLTNKFGFVHYPFHLQDFRVNVYMDKDVMQNSVMTRCHSLLGEACPRKCDGAPDDAHPWNLTVAFTLNQRS
jgi:hypothetical protein